MNTIGVTEHTRVRPHRAFVVICAIIIGTVVGCTGTAQSPRATEQYVLEYAEPEVGRNAPADATITINRFSIAKEYATTDMVYRTAPFSRTAYYYHRWRVTPADMVTDLLLRDIQRSGMFKASFPDRHAEKTSYSLGGHVGEFLKIDEGEPARAVLGLSAVLIDASEKDALQRIIFQSSYRAEVPLADRTPAGYARGLSKAMEAISRSLLNDIHKKLETLTD